MLLVGQVERLSSDREESDLLTALQRHTELPEAGGVPIAGLGGTS